jgi:hypothetical protein
MLDRDDAPINPRDRLVKEYQEHQDYAESNSVAIEQLGRNLQWQREHHGTAYGSKSRFSVSGRLGPLLLLVFLVLGERLLLGNYSSAMISFVHVLIALDIVAAGILLFPSRRRKMRQARRVADTPYRS